ncbi:MAG: hypothetical protein U1E27_00485 [Kiritimatiellia bacterium]|nr:hypothetical protein [Kiritimatiellia bacterium]
MRRRVNRKKNSGFLFPAPLAILLTAIAGFFLSYLWLCSRCEVLAREIKSVEERQDETRRRVVNEQFKWESQKSLSRIQARLEAAGIVMSFPPPTRVIHLDRPLQLADLDPDQAWGHQLVRATDREPVRLHD